MKTHVGAVLRLFLISGCMHDVDRSQCADLHREVALDIQLYGGKRVRVCGVELCRVCRVKGRLSLLW
jgi:hypothetical protein